MQQHLIEYIGGPLCGIVTEFVDPPAHVIQEVPTANAACGGGNGLEPLRYEKKLTKLDDQKRLVQIYEFEGFRRGR